MNSGFINPRETIVIGAGGQAKVVISSLIEAGGKVSAVYDDDSTLWGSEILGVRIEGPIEKLKQKPPRCPVILAIGDNTVRKRLAEELAFDWAIVIHPRAYVYRDVQIGAGSVVFAMSVLQPGARVGRHAIINTSAGIEHDCKVGDFAHISVHCQLGGGTVIEERALLGISSCTLPGIHIGAGRLG